MRWGLVILTCLGAIACGDGDGAEQPVTVKMDFARASLYDAPFPADDLIQADGTVDLSGFANPDDIIIINDLLDRLDGRARGFGTTSTIFMPLTGAIDPATLPSIADSTSPESSVFLISVDTNSPDYLQRYPVSVLYEPTGGPFGPAEHPLAIMPVQGIPLLPNTTYAAVVMTSVTDVAGNPLQVSPTMAALARGESIGVASLETATFALGTVGFDVEAIAGMTAFTTQNATTELSEFLDHARGLTTPAINAPFQLIETYDDYCVYRTTIDMPSYQTGAPPFQTTGGGWPDVPEVQVDEESRLFVTIPRGAMPVTGWPTAVMVRTGGGGDRPMIDRGVRNAEGIAEVGSGPAVQFARSGFAGVMIDGPLGGIRNVSGADEQFLIFNIQNVPAMLDNIRQSALELALLPDVLATLSIDTTGCPGTSGGPATVDLAHVALMGHSMGATIAPLVLANSDVYGAAILSGAGGSWIHNVMYKRRPLEILPIAEALLGYRTHDRLLVEQDPALMLLQWAGESADPPPYGAAVISDTATPRHVLMVQGIVDTYILPPIANSTSLSIGLDLAGDSLDVGHPGLTEFPPLTDMLPLVEREQISLPASGNRFVNGDTYITAVVVQHNEDGVEDGHEVMFQLDNPKIQYEAFLRSWVGDTTPTVPVPPVTK